MRKSQKRRRRGSVRAFASLLFMCALPLIASDVNPGLYNQIASGDVDRAQNQLARIRMLVDAGALPKIRLDEAQAQLDDARDQAILSETLYGTARVQDITEQQAAEMVTAAQKRVDRQAKLVADREGLVEKGVIAPAEIQALHDELDSRNRVLSIAQDRANLLKDLQRIAAAEQHWADAAQSMAAKNVMVRYDGNGLFDLSDLTVISSGFERQFHRPLPVSAVGQTAVHQAMGLDHRNRVDIALNPDQPDGIWLRQFLEKLHVPYLAFRTAVAGAATAPHIHIGLESTRLKLAAR